MLPSIAKSGWWQTDFIADGPVGHSACCKPEQLFGLTGLDNLTHSLFWSMLANLGLYVGVSLWRTPSAHETSQALAVRRCLRPHPDCAAGVLARPRAGRRSAGAGAALSRRRASPTACSPTMRGSAAQRRSTQIEPDAQLVQFVETRLAGAIGSASARVMVASVVEEEALDIDDVLAHPRRGLAAASAFAGARERPPRELRACQPAAGRPGPAEGRFHVVGDARAAHAADVDPRPDRD